MLPYLRPGKIIIATGLCTQVQVGNVVIVSHEGLEKVKRVAEIKGHSIYALGDNPNASTDSRHFGWIPIKSITAKVIWPRI